MWYKNVGTSFFHFVTFRAFDRQETDIQTDAQKGIGNTVRCITCSRTVKIQKSKFPVLILFVAVFTVHAFISTASCNINIIAIAMTRCYSLCNIFHIFLRPFLAGYST